MKYCPGCQQDRDESEFYVDPKRRGGGLSSACKECLRARNRRYWRERYYPAHREEHIAAVLERRRQRKTDATQEEG